MTTTAERNDLIPPHLNSELYKSFQGNIDTLPYLDYIQVHPNGSMLIGCSELTGRRWKGAVHFFKPGTETKDVVFKPGNAVCFSGSTNDGCFVGSSNKILTGDDTGVLKLWSHRQFPPHIWLEDITVHLHDDMIMGVECLLPQEVYVTVGADGHIKVYDILSLICVRNYEHAHSNIICNVSVKPNSTTVMATGSYDRTICLWDEKVVKPVQNVLKSDCGIRCVQWLNEHTLVYGNEAGVLSTVDVRNQSTTNIAELPTPIHRIIVKSDEKNVAVCGDSRKVFVYDVSGVKSQLLYENNDHTNFVRGLAWDANKSDTFISVGWDHIVNSHKYK